MKAKMFAFCAIAAAGSALAVPEIREGSVSMEQDKGSRIVTISYTLDNAPAIVTVDILTNGVSLGGALLRGKLEGEINRKVAAGTHTITWRPSRDARISGVKDWAESAKAVVTAWPTNAPPTWMVVDLVESGAVEFYPDESWFPEPINSDTYKTDKLVMRKIPARGLAYRLGSPNPVGHGTFAEAGRAGDGQTPNELSRPVMLTSDYYIGVFEVTQKQYSHFATVPSGQSVTGDTYPVGRMSWQALRGNCPGYFWPTQGHSVDSTKFIGQLRTHSGGIKFDLPTEAQWEIACRAGEGAAFNNGCISTNILDEADRAAIESISWTTINSGGKSHPVGQKEPNRWGLYDMHGNVGEFTLDLVSTTWAGGVTVSDPDLAQAFKDYSACRDLMIDPPGPPCDRQGLTDGTEPSFVKGGRYDQSVKDTRSASRLSFRRDYALAYIGFRLCCPASLY